MPANKTRNVVDYLQTILDKQDLQSIYSILHNGVQSSELRKLNLPHTNSRILIENKHIIYCTCYYKLGGLFKKGENHKGTTLFGRIICDQIKETRQNRGFFTTDELPSYGISELEKKSILAIFDARERDLVACFAYNEVEANMTNLLLEELLNTTTAQFNQLYNSELNSSST
jgi:Glu-tRNA(Gln) amidotransferase subunit E-like FAD-binding protein